MKNSYDFVKFELRNEKIIRRKSFKRCCPHFKLPLFWMIVFNLHQSRCTASHQHVLEFVLELVILRVQCHFISEQLHFFCVLGNQHSENFVLEWCHALRSDFFHNSNPPWSSGPRLKCRFCQLQTLNLKDFELIYRDLDVLRIVFVAKQVRLDSQFLKPRLILFAKGQIVLAPKVLLKFLV